MSDERVLLVYDGDCGVCTDSALWVADRSDVQAVPFDETPEDVKALLPDEWRDCAHLVDGQDVLSCGAAMEAAFLRTDHPAAPIVRMAGRLPGHAHMREIGYRHFADNRGIVGRIWRRVK